MRTQNPSVHMGIGPKKNAYGDSLFANGCCMHMVINIYTWILSMEIKLVLKIFPITIYKMFWSRIS